MTLQFFFALASSCIGIFGFMPYLRDIFRRTTQPHSYTWLIWTLLQITGVIAMFAAGAGMVGVASLSIGTLFTFSIWILSLRYGTHNINTFDKICLAGGFLALGIYLFLHDPLLSVVVVATTDLLGFLPTFRKAYEEPATETALTYILGSIASIFAVGALMNFNVSTSLYPISLAVTNGVCASIILVRRR